jgi:radical SAM superfamily enzyme
MRIVLVNPPSSDWIISFLPPLGTATLLPFLRKNGFNVETEDLLIKVRYANKFRFRNRINLSIFTDLRRVSNFLNGMKDREIKNEALKMLSLGKLHKFDVIGFSITCNDSLLFSLCLSKILKEMYKNKTIIIGGSFTTTLKTDYSELVKFPCVDYLVNYDGEIPILKILNHLEYGDEIKAEGLSFKGHKDNNKNFYPIEKKETPIFDVKMFTLYSKLYGSIILPYTLGRGCFNKCTFCIMYKTNQFEYKPINKVVKELKTLKRMYRVSSFFFCDSNINNDYRHLEKLCDTLIKENINIQWGGFASVKNLDSDILKKMKQSGCSFLKFGIESGSDDILRKMNKGFNSEKAENVLKDASKVGIKSETFFICGFPHETEEDHEQTKNFIERNSSFIYSVYVFPFELHKNSIIYNFPKQFGIRVIVVHVVITGNVMVFKCVPIMLTVLVEGASMSCRLGLATVIKVVILMRVNLMRIVQVGRCVRLIVNVIHQNQQPLQLLLQPLQQLLQPLQLFLHLKQQQPQLLHSVVTVHVTVQKLILLAHRIVVNRIVRQPMILLVIPSVMVTMDVRINVLCIQNALLECGVLLVVSVYRTPLLT